MWLAVFADELVVSGLHQLSPVNGVILVAVVCFERYVNLQFHLHFVGNLAITVDRYRTYGDLAAGQENSFGVIDGGVLGRRCIVYGVIEGYIGVVTHIP